MAKLCLAIPKRGLKRVEVCLEIPKRELKDPKYSYQSQNVDSNVSEYA